MRRLLPASKAIDLAREAYVKLARGEATNPPRLMLSVPTGASMYFMPAYVHGQRTVTLKVARMNPQNSKIAFPTVMLTVYVYDAKTGAQVAEIEGEWLTAVRTAASTAVATDLLARNNARVLGVFGSGTQASSHISVLKMVRKFDQVIIYSRDKHRREAFAKRMSRQNRLPTMISNSPARVVQESDVILTATTSFSPVFDGTLVQAGTHVNAIGSAAPNAREVDTNLVRRSKLVVDSRAQALATYGDIMTPIKQGAIRESNILELGDLLLKHSRLIRRSAEITLFKSGGLAVLDAVMAGHLVKAIGKKQSH